jgi:P4 family phage/plasmid primase-like protien
MELQIEDAAPVASRGGVEKAEKNRDGNFLPGRLRIVKGPESPLTRRANAAAALAYMFPDADAAIELCALGLRTPRSDAWAGGAFGKKPLAAGWFTDREKLIALAFQIDDSDTRPVGIHVTLNPVNPALLARADHRLIANASRTGKMEIARRSNLLLDFDPKRPEGISATTEEKERARTVSKAALAFLRNEHGWPEPMICDSGNGFHFIFKVDLSVADETQVLVQTALLALDQRFGKDSESIINVDVSVADPNRLTKFYGTMARKGENTSERPHRRSRVFTIPEEPKAVTEAQLRALAALADTAGPKAPNGFDRKGDGHRVAVAQYLEDHDVEVTAVKTRDDGALMYCLKHCLFNPSHEDGEACIIELLNGKLLYKCFHDSCSDKKWPDARKEISGDEPLGKWMVGGKKQRRMNKAEAPTQDELALLFAEKHMDELRYDHHAGCWYQWDGTRWKKEETSLAFSWARDLCRDNAVNDKGEKISGVCTVSMASAVERFSQTDRRLAVTSDIWDTDTFALGTPGGVVDLRTGEVRESSPQDYLTKQCAVTPAAVADCPLWRTFLDEATKGDKALQRFMQQIAGYSLTGDTREHALFFIHGPGGNGKSVFLDTITNILGDYATTSAMETFTEAKGDRHPTELAMLRGARLITASETEEGRAWAESRIKQLTGGDKVAARFMRQDFFEYTPAFKLLIIGNNQPILRNVDDAARRRFNIIPFIFKPEQVDMELKDKLRAEYPAILRWMIEGGLDWQENGLTRPAVVHTSTADYFDEQDLFGQWMAEECETGDRMRDTSNALFAAWKRFAEAQGEKPGDMRALASNLRRRGFSSWRSGKARGYEGLRLIPDESFEAA